MPTVGRAYNRTSQRSNTTLRYVEFSVVPEHNAGWMELFASGARMVIAFEDGNGEPTWSLTLDGTRAVTASLHQLRAR